MSNDIVLTCHQTGCMNAEIPIPVPLSDDPEVPIPQSGWCGGCQTEITDMQIVPSGSVVTPTADNVDAIRAAAVAKQS
jgi:hypothetical protein